MSAFCREMKAILAAVQGSQSAAEVIARASAVAGVSFNENSLRKRFASHRDCCSAPTIGEVYGSRFTPPERRTGYTGAPVVDFDEDERDTLPGMRAPTPLPDAPNVDELRERLYARAFADAVAGNASDVFERLHAAVKTGPVSFSDLCDKLDLAPSKMRKAIEDARARGMRVDVEHDHVGMRPTVDETRIQEIGVPPIVGGTQHLAVISDLHLGSKYCLREQLKDFVHHAYASGVREVMVPGDLLDGCYKHGLWELSHHGLDEQADDLFETLPCLPGLNYRAITGNHDETFEDTCGIHVGPYITDRFRSRGRHDLRFYGRRGAFVRVGGAIVEMWHPRGGGSYAKSYRLQKKIEGYAVGHKPHLLVVGHWHQYCHLFERGVHAFLCPTFQGGGSSFGKSLGGAPTIGGLVMSWEMTEGGTMRRFRHEYSAYFEAERIAHVDEVA